MFKEQTIPILYTRCTGLFIALLCLLFPGCTMKDTVTQTVFSYPSDYYKDAIVLSLSFDGTTTDSSRYANNGFAVNTAYVVGKTNQGIHLSASSLGYVYYPDTIYYHTPTVTAEAWIKMDNTPSHMTILTECIQGAAAVGKGYIFDILDNHLRFFIGDASGAWSVATGTSVLLVNVWYHVVGLYDGQTLKVFINGQVDGSIAIGSKLISYQPSSADGPSPSVFYVGVTHNSIKSLPTQQLDLTYPFIGTIDNVRVYDRALSDAEVLAVFQASK